MAYHTDLNRLAAPSALSVLLLAMSSAYAADNKALDLNEMVITASGYEQQLIDAPASITVIGKDQLEGKYYRDVTDALQDIPGVSIEGGAGGKLETTSVNIRGLGENYTLFLVNGKPLGASSEAYYNGFSGGAQVGWLPPLAAIERIEVIRGPMSSLYGSSALAGVINIITKQDTPQEWSGRISHDRLFQHDQHAGNSNQTSYFLSGPLATERLAMSVFGSYYHRDEDRIANGYADKSSFDNTLQLDLNVNESNKLQFAVGQAKHTNERTEKSGTPMDMDNERNHYGITHDWLWGERAQTTSYVTHEKVDIKNSSLRSDFSSTFANTKTVMPFERHILTVGGEYKWETTNHDGSRFYGATNSLKLDRWQRALFVEDEFFVTDALSVTGGMRFDENEHYGKKVIPRLYGVYRFTPQFVLKGGVSGGYKAPTLKQADPNIVENAARSRAFDMGNYDLKPETSVNYEVGLMWDADNGIRSGVTTYYTTFKDKIGKHIVCDSRPSGGDSVCEVGGVQRQYINQYINQDQAELRGVEVFFNVPLGELELTTNYTYSDSKITKSEASPEEVGKPFNNLPRHMFNVGLDWRFNDALSFWGKARYKSKTVEDSASQIPAYSLVDVGTLYRLNKNWEVYAGLYNVFNKQVTAEDYGKTLDGRRLNVGVAFDF